MGRITSSGSSCLPCNLWLAAIFAPILCQALRGATLVYSTTSRYGSLSERQRAASASIPAKNTHSHSTRAASRERSSKPFKLQWIHDESHRSHEPGDKRSFQLFLTRYFLSVFAAGGALMGEMMAQGTLLADYVTKGSEQAFAELVGRYVNLVYSTGMRLVNGDTHLAEAVAQTVFANWRFV